MDEIARRAGVAVGTLYNYFGGRERLVRAVLERRHHELDARLAQLEDLALSLPVAVERIVGEVFEHCAQHAAFFSVILHDDRIVPRPGGHGEGMRIVLRHLGRAFEDAVRRGAIDETRAALDTELTVGCIRAGIIFVLARNGDETSWRDTAQRITSFVLAGCSRA